LLNRASKTAAYLVEIYNRTMNSNFSTIKKMDEHLKSIKTKEKKIDSESSEEGSDYKDDDEKLGDRNKNYENYYVCKIMFYFYLKR
jgi:hypothetical protein